MRTDRTSTSGRPNVLVILADDMGYSDVGCYGGEIGTPNIDSLAERGTRLTHFYNTARCSPSRASLLTGLHPHQTGVAELVDNDGPGGYPGSLNDRCATLAESFRAAGYQTHMTGKWHLSNERERPADTWPTRRGFDRFWGTISGAGSYFQTTTLHDGETSIPLSELGDDFYYTDEIGSHAAAAIRAALAGDQGPFFGYVAFTAPHWPLHAKDEDLANTRGRFDEGWDVLRLRRHRRQLDLGICAADTTLGDRDPAYRPGTTRPSRSGSWSGWRRTPRRSRRWIGPTARFSPRWTALDNAGTPSWSSCPTTAAVRRSSAAPGRFRGQPGRALRRDPPAPGPGRLHPGPAD